MNIDAVPAYTSSSLADVIIFLQMYISMNECMYCMGTSTYFSKKNSVVICEYYEWNLPPYLHCCNSYLGLLVRLYKWIWRFSFKLDCFTGYILCVIDNSRWPSDCTYNLYPQIKNVDCQLVWVFDDLLCLTLCSETKFVNLHEQKKSFFF